MTQKDKKQEPAGNSISPEKAQELIEKLNGIIDQYGVEAKIFKKDYIQSLDARESSVAVRESDLAARESTITARGKSADTRLAEAIAKEMETQNRLAAIAKEMETQNRLAEIAAKEKAFEKIGADLEKQANDVAAKKAEIFSSAEKLAAQLHDKRIQETEEEVQRIRDAAFEEAQKIRDAALADAQKTREAAETAAQSTREDAQKNVESALAAVEKQVKEILDGAKANAKLLVDEATSQATQAIKAAEEKANGLNGQIKELTGKNAELAGKIAKRISEAVRAKPNLLRSCRDQISTSPIPPIINLLQYLKIRRQFG